VNALSEQRLDRKKAEIFVRAVIGQASMISAPPRSLDDHISTLSKARSLAQKYSMWEDLPKIYLAEAEHLEPKDRRKEAQRLIEKGLHRAEETGKKESANHVAHDTRKN
jgi:hypothetical protein